MNPPLRLGFRDPLHAVPAAFKSEAVIRTVAGDRKNRFFDATHVGIRDVDQLGLPALGVGVFLIHAQQVIGEQGRFFAAGPRADFHDEARAGERIAREDHLLQFGHQLVVTRFERGDFRKCVLASVGIGLIAGHHFRRGDLVSQAVEFPNSQGDFGQTTVFAL